MHIAFSLQWATVKRVRIYFLSAKKNWLLKVAALSSKSEIIHAKWPRSELMNQYDDRGNDFGTRSCLRANLVLTCSLIC